VDLLSAITTHQKTISYLYHQRVTHALRNNFAWADVNMLLSFNFLWSKLLNKWHVGRLCFSYLFAELQKGTLSKLGKTQTGPSNLKFVKILGSTSFHCETNDNEIENIDRIICQYFLFHYHWWNHSVCWQKALTWLTCSIIRFPNGLLSAPRFIIISMQLSAKPGKTKTAREARQMRWWVTTHCRIVFFLILPMLRS